MDGQLCLNASIKFVEYTKKKIEIITVRRKPEKRQIYKVGTDYTPVWKFKMF
jgi:hypothetical protein